MCGGWPCRWLDPFLPVSSNSVPEFPVCSSVGQAVVTASLALARLALNPRRSRRKMLENKNKWLMCLFHRLVVELSRLTKIKLSFRKDCLEEW